MLRISVAVTANLPYFELDFALLVVEELHFIPKTKLGVELTFLTIHWEPLVVSHFCYLRTYIIPFWGNSWKLFAPFLLLIFNYSSVNVLYKDLLHPNKDLFSTHALILVHFKTVHYFSQPIFSLFSYKKNAPHNFVIELCSALFPPKKYCKVIY